MAATTDNYLFLWFHVTIKTRHFSRPTNLDILSSDIPVISMILLHPYNYYFFPSQPEFHHLQSTNRLARACDPIWLEFDRFPQSRVRDSSRCAWACRGGNVVEPPPHHLFRGTITPILPYKMFSQQLCSLILLTRSPIHPLMDSYTDTKHTPYLIKRVLVRGRFWIFKRCRRWNLLTVANAMHGIFYAWNH